MYNYLRFNDSEQSFIKLKNSDSVWFIHDSKFIHGIVCGRVRNSHYFTILSKRFPQKVIIAHAAIVYATPPFNIKDCKISPHMWHVNRRMAMMKKYPEIRNLSAHKPNYISLLFGLLLGHGFGVYISSCIDMWWFSVLLSSTVGAILSFGIQQTVHEISHNVVNIGAPHWILMIASEYVFGISGPGFCFYYMFLHKQHHTCTGGKNDPDYAFQSYWSRMPIILAKNVVGRWLWLTLVGFFTKIIMVITHITNVYPLNFLTNSPTLLVAYFSSFLLFAVTLTKCWGFWSFFYLWSSSAFALGACAHPYLGFWIMQHLSSPLTKYQPTISYNGSTFWHWCNFGALYHIEHHDIPNVSFLHIDKIQSIASEFYDDLISINSISNLVLTWLNHTDGSEWMDFAGNQKFQLSKEIVMLASDATGRFVVK